MANTYTQIHIQLVFAVKHRKAFIQKSWRDKLHAYITGIIQKHDHKVLCINSQPDHIHILIGFRPTQALSDLVEIVKRSSNVYINSNKLTPQYFAWQKGYGAFSYSKSQVAAVTKYIINQDEHHKKRLFKDEYVEILRKSEIEYDELFLFDFWD
ncbi:MAG: IS200/IS605 family transposase [Saprospiraceae bacterium]|nr:IS200/IS605 family transposase [Saprospiraceae bacterium]